MANNTRLPRFRRADNPPPMLFQDRDGEILEMIYALDGVVAKRHLKEIYWRDKADRVMKIRLSKLYHNGYIDWPTEQQRKTKPVPEPICFLGWKGILWIASRSGIKVELPHGDNENQLRRLEIALRSQGIRWVREPRWIQLQHDLAVIDFRLAVEKAIENTPSLMLEEWMHEGVFRANTDVISYESEGKNGGTKKLKKGVCPDSYFVIIDKHRMAGGTKARVRFLLELDNATHDNPSFGREKAFPGVAYIVSPEYKNRFGNNSGRWLIVTTGQRRMENLKRYTEQVVGKNASVFYFTTFDQIRPETVLSSPIWWRGGEESLTSLF